ncbi:MAG TPA: hypothetical protein VHA70_05470 [Bauldia sp.]|nr:hypothetical protein [Bauldia sp.]
MTDDELLKALDRLKGTMTAVATGGPRIDDVNREFGLIFDAVAIELASRGINNAIPFRDLWQWYGKWSADLQGYASRRVFVANIFDILTAQVLGNRNSVYEPTGWNRVDRAIADARGRLSSAKTEEQFQTVGLLCRELLISIAQAVFDAAHHPTLDGVTASSTDAKRMLEAYIAVELAGSSNETMRKFAKAALELASQLVHRRTATYRDAALCVEASTAVTNAVAIMAGIRNPK